MTSAPHPFDFFGRLAWLDGEPLMDTIESYRRRLFEDALCALGPDGSPRYDRVLSGRAKKNWKTTDLALAALYKLLACDSPAGNDCFVLANDEGQAADDLSLVKKLVARNPILDREVTVKQKEITRRDGRGSMTILPAQDAVGAHGKTFSFVGFDEIHGYKNYDLFEALSPDPTRRDVLTWITSYAGIRHAPGIPLYDMMQAGRTDADPRLLFSWYAADFSTDPAFASEELTPEQRANPSMLSWADPSYLETQRRRLPTAKYRRLHLNLPGAPDGAALSGEHIMAAIVPGRRRLPREHGIRYVAFVDMSGGSSDDAVLAIAHRTAGDNVVLDALVAQTGRPPFNPRRAIAKFVTVLREYGVSHVVGDAFGGLTFRQDFEALRVSYKLADKSKSDLYEELDPRLNASEVELLDVPGLQEQLLTLVWRGQKIDHVPGGHDDYANACAGAVWLAVSHVQPVVVTPAAMAWARRPSPSRLRRRLDPNGPTGRIRM
jgi:hypothetical protein